MQSLRYVPEADGCRRCGMDAEKYPIIYENGIPIAIIIQYGHGTGTGGYVKGRDYINPALRPIFDELAKNAWREVTK